MAEQKAEGIVVAGKTGSAEVTKQLPAHAWYVCFAPAEEPEIAVCVLIEQAGTGSRYAVPAAKELLEKYDYFGFKGKEFGLKNRRVEFSFI